MSLRISLGARSQIVSNFKKEVAVASQEVKGQDEKEGEKMHIMLRFFNFSPGMCDKFRNQKHCCENSSLYVKRFAGHIDI